MPRHSVTILQVKDESKACVVSVPPEEFGVKRSTRALKDCNYCFHRIPDMTEADLIEQGYDKEQVKALPGHDDTESTEELSRDSVDESAFAKNDLNRASRRIDVTEHYIRMDYEGNGKVKLYKVTTGGTQGDILKRDGKLDIEEMDAIPFAVVTPIPIPHRFFGRSIADVTMDLQRIKTALTRALLDNAYMVVNPRPTVAENLSGPSTIDDLLVSKHGALIRAKMPGAVEWQAVPDISGSIYPALQYIDSMRELRTGVTKQGQGIDADALQNQSATAVNQVFTMSQQRLKLMAMNCAAGVRDMFALLHGVIRKHGQQAQTVRLRNEWVTVDPREWKTRNDMTINVGLGSGGKSEQFAKIVALGNMQKEMIAGGKTNLVDDEKLFNMASEATKIMGYRNADRFFNDPSAKNEQGQPKYPPPPPPVDPKIMQIQTQAELDAKADERKAGIEKVQAEADIATQDRKTNAEMIQSQRDAELKAHLAVLQANLEREKFEREEARKDREHAQKMELAREQHQQAMQAGAFKMAAGAEQHQQKMQQAESKGEGE